MKTSQKSGLSPIYRRVLTVLRALAVAVLAAPALVPAQSPGAPGFPPQQIRIVVPFTAGGGTDVIARLVAKHLAEAWKVAVLIDNRVGAGGVVGSQWVTT